MADDIFDFGFTAVDEEELEAVQAAKQQASDVEYFYGIYKPFRKNLRLIYRRSIPLKLTVFSFQAYQV